MIPCNHRLNLGLLINLGVGLEEWFRVDVDDSNGFGGLGDRGWGLEGWFRVAVDGNNRFGSDWWPRKIRSVVEGCGYDRSLFWATVLGTIRVMEIG
ncbi:hypothetical protein BHE74_00049125 [Ensete ventricosum]|nr:hypothetical protein BHE74_00049125 [Ensete ventricosum]